MIKKIPYQKYVIHIINTIFALAVLMVPMNISAQKIDIETEFMLGYTEYQSGQFRGALSHFEKVIGFINQYQIEEIPDEVLLSIYVISGTCSRAVGNYNQSLDYCNKALALQNIPEEYLETLLISKLQLCNDLSKDDECIETAKELLKLYSTNKNIDLVQALTSYYLAHEKYVDIIQFEPDLLILNSKDDSEIDLLSNRIAMENIYNALGRSFFELSYFDKSLQYFLKALDFLTEFTEKDRSMIYAYISNVYDKMGDRKNSLKYQKLAVEYQLDYSSFAKALQINEDSDSNNEKVRYKRYKADQLLTLGMRYDSNDMVLESIDCFEKADSLYKSIDNKDYHAYTLTLLYSSYHVLGDKDKYNAIRHELINIERLNNIEDETIKLILSSNVGEFYEDDGDYERALKFYNKLLDKESKYYNEHLSKKFSLLYKMTNVCLKLSDISNAFLYVETLKEISKLYNIESEDFFKLILIESEILHKQGNIGTAIKLLEKYADKLEKEYELKSIKSGYYDSLGGLYIEVGDLEEALKYSQMALELCKETNTANSQDYAINLLNISVIYGLLGNHLKALELTTEACNIMKRLYTKNHPMYYASLKKLASTYSWVDQTKSQALYDECLILSKNIFGDKSNEYADMLIECNLNLLLNPSENEIANVEMGIDIKRNNGYFDDFYLSNLHCFSAMLLGKQDWTKLYSIANETLDRARNYIASNFRNLSGYQRDALWKHVKPALDGIELAAANHNEWAAENHKFELVNQYSALAYDARLLKKGLLLTSTQRLKELINNSVNSDVINIQQQLNILYQNLNNETSVNDKANIQRTINNLERNLIDIASSNGDFLDFTNIHWQDIQNELMPGEVAIEFFSFPCQDDIQYGMSYIGSEGYPLAIGLFMESELNKFQIGETGEFDYDNPGLYKTIWSVLDVFSEINNAHTIYFSPDGILNVINIENLRDFDGKLASDKRYLCRLSSTRELLRRASESNKENAVLYGGLKYEMDKDSLVAESRSGDYHPISTPRALPIESLRYGVEDLPESLTEVNNIANLFALKPTLITGKSGTEESFKALENSNYDIIHLATHGFFWSNDDANTRSYVNFLDNSNFQELTAEENAMLRSCLVFSGANIGLMGKELPEDVEDGILTAKELSTMNLGNVDLVVMSACESGLGEISGEGVFGLQRGFKLAGANTLLMSLWKVDDKATSELMIEFYKHYLTGKSKQESLRLAQLKLRNSEEYSDPEYWAAFILLDALN